MQTQAVLTFGWPEASSSQPAATELLELVQEKGVDAARAWMEAVSSTGRLRLTGLDHLFRRRPGGLRTLRSFVWHLGELLVGPEETLPVECECDAFAYAFLKRTHNFDVILPEKEPDGRHRAKRRRLEAGLSALTEYERHGTPIPVAVGIDQGDYLALRRCLTRPSARLVV
ncbi:MAG: hypothetical protein AAFV49_01450 [Pseudomonadota bacterium]